MKRFLRFAAALLLFSLVIFASSDEVFAGAISTENWNPSFERAVRDVLGVAPGASITTTLADLVLMLSIEARDLDGLDGIEYFTNLQVLDAAQNNLTSVDLSRNRALTKVWLEDNRLTHVNTSANPDLLVLDVTNNLLTEVDVSQNTALAELWAGQNRLTRQDLSQNPALEALDLGQNYITHLDFSRNPGLTDVWVNDNLLETLDMSANPALRALDAGSNRLTHVDISQNPLLLELELYNNQLSRIDTSGNHALRYLSVRLNHLTGLDISQNPNLALLWADDNSITTLDVRQNPALRMLHIELNNIASPDHVIGWNLRFDHAANAQDWDWDQPFWFFPQNPGFAQAPLMPQAPIAPAPRPSYVNLYGASAWSQDYIMDGVLRGFVPEDLIGHFTQPITRAEFAALAVGLYEAVMGAPITGRAAFGDTDDVNVQKMGYLGVVTGVGHGNFNPHGTITRQEAAVIMMRLAAAIGAPLQYAPATFSDIAEAAPWARSAIGAVQNTGIMGGISATRFAPFGTYTREQSIITIVRLALGL